MQGTPMADRPSTLPPSADHTAATRLCLLSSVILLARLLDSLERRLHGLPEQVGLHLQVSSR